MNEQSPTPPTTSKPPAPPISTAPPPASRSTWPMVIGIIGCIWAGVAILGSVCGVAMVPFWSWYVEQFGHMLPPGQREQLVQMDQTLGWMIATGAVSVILAILLLVGSIRLLKRRAKGVTLLRIWSIIQLIWAPVGTIIGVLIMPELELETDDPAVLGGTIGGLIGASIGFLLGVALPIFLLVWFARRSIKQEVAGWPVKPASSTT